jgi:tetratricopeptide (TPR) repeat protein
MVNIYTDFNGKRSFNSQLFEKKIEEFSSKSLEQFRKTTRFYARFHTFFIFFFTAEIFSLLFFSSFFSKTYLMALSVAFLFLSLFSYLVLLFYFQAKKPQQFLELQNKFTTGCHEVIPFEKTHHEYHLSIAEALHCFVEKLEHLESRCLKFGKQGEPLSLLMQKFNAWLYWKDIHKMKELLLYLCIDKYLELVKLEPTDLEAHASLANAYVTLSKLYLDPRKKDPDFNFRWISNEYNKEQMQDKFTFAAERAIEEFKILDDYAPDDPWVHAQLACVFHDLEMIEEEIFEYEKMLEISPDDRHVLFRLGVLYFQQGENAKGLRIYQKLKFSQDEMAEDLITFYGSCSLKE